MTEQDKERVFGWVEKMGVKMEGLATKLGKTAEHLWPAAIRYKALEAVAAVVCCLVVCVVLGYWSWHLRAGALAREAVCVASAIPNSAGYIDRYCPDASGYWWGSVLLALAAIVPLGVASTYFATIFQPEGALVAQALENRR